MVISVYPKPASFGNAMVQVFSGIEGIDILGFGFVIILDCNFSKSFGKKFVQTPRFAISLAWIQPAYSPVSGHDHSNQFEIPGNLFLALLPLPDSVKNQIIL